MTETTPSEYEPPPDWEIALRYISSPTMGLPGGRDALDYVDEASESNVRLALKACIRTARQALAGNPPSAPTENASQEAP